MEGSKFKYLKNRLLRTSIFVEYSVHLQVNGELLNKQKLSASSTVQQLAILDSSQPVGMALEARLTEWIKDMHGM